MIGLKQVFRFFWMVTTASSFPNKSNSHSVTFLSESSLQSVIKAEREKSVAIVTSRGKRHREIYCIYCEEKERVLFVYRVREKKRETQNSFTRCEINWRRFRYKTHTSHKKRDTNNASGRGEEEIRRVRWEQQQQQQQQRKGKRG